MIVLSGKQPMQVKPSFETSRIKTLEPGTRVEAIGRSDGWLKIIHQGRIGYIRDTGTDRPPPAIAPASKNRNTRTGLARQAVTIQKDIQKHRKQVSALTKEERDTLKEFGRADHALSALQKKASTVKSALAELEKQLRYTEVESKELTDQIQTAEAYAARRLVALYKLNRMGKINLLARAESISALLYLRKSLEQILEADADFHNRLKEKKSGLSRVKAQLTEQKERKRALEKDYLEKIKTLSRQKRHRSMLLGKIRSRRQLQVAALEELQQAAAQLDRAIKSYKNRRLSLKSDKTARVVLSETKGLRRMPVRGKIVSRFGAYVDPKFQMTHQRNGIEIKAEAGSPIYAVAGGTVAFADWFKGYGNMMIIDHGDGYFTVYANTHEMFKSGGDTVSNNEVIATVGETGSLIGPKLYFEVRYQGKPIDPLIWMKPG